ncbi:hypothetical protein BDAP_000983 [Binucleata daphniae]
MDLFFSKFDHNVLTSAVYKGSLVLSLSDLSIIEICKSNKQRKIVLKTEEKIYEMAADKYLVMLGHKSVYITTKNSIYTILCKINVPIKFISTFGDFVVLSKYYDVVLLKIGQKIDGIVDKKSSKINFFGFTFEKKVFEKDVISRSLKMFKGKDKYLQNEEYYEIVNAISNNVNNKTTKEKSKENTASNTVCNSENSFVGFFSIYKILEFGNKIKGIQVTKQNLIVYTSNVVYFYNYKDYTTKKVKLDFYLDAFEYFYDCLIVSSEKTVYKIEDKCEVNTKCIANNDVHFNNMYDPDNVISGDECKNLIYNKRDNYSTSSDECQNSIYSICDKNTINARINKFENADKYKCTELFRLDKSVKRIYNLDGIIVCDSDYCYKVNYNEKQKHEKMCLSYRKLWKNKLILYDKRIFAIEENYLLELRNHTNNFLESIAGKDNRNKHKK